MILSGKPADSIGFFELALRLAPNDYRLFFKHGELALAHLMMGAYQRACRHADTSLSVRPTYWHAHVTRINALARSGCVAQARAAFAELRAIRPNFTMEYIDWVPFQDGSWNRFLKDGLQLAET